MTRLTPCPHKCPHCSVSVPPIRSSSLGSAVGSIAAAGATRFGRKALGGRWLGDIVQGGPPGPVFLWAAAWPLAAIKRKVGSAHRPGFNPSSIRSLSGTTRNRLHPSGSDIYDAISEI